MVGNPEAAKLREELYAPRPKEKLTPDMQRQNRETFAKLQSQTG